MDVLLLCFLHAMVFTQPTPSQDFDRDGLSDVEDDCPTDPGDAKNRGCPDAPKPPPEPPREKPRITVAEDRIDLSETVLFRTGSARVDPKSFSLLVEIASGIRSLPPTKRVLVAGHTDGKGSVARNEELSTERAEAVIAHLVRAGVPREKLSSVGRGPHAPIASNDTEAGRMKNRRVEFLIIE